MARLFRRYWSSVSVRIPDLQQRANAARDAWRWDDATALFARAAAASPKQAGELWVQAGNCAKEAGQFPKAFEHYREAERVLQQTPDAERNETWRAKRADLLLQLGHLLKLAGNFSACAHAYRSAAELGSQGGHQELQAWHHLPASVMRFGRSAEAGVSSSSFLAICSCELRPLEVEPLREAARTLAKHPGSSDLARAFAEMAYLADQSPNAADNHVALTSQCGLGMPNAPASAQPAGKPAEPREMVRDAALRLADELADEYAPALPLRHAMSRAVPFNPDPFSADAGAFRHALTSGIDAAFVAAWAKPDDFVQRLSDAFDQLRAVAKPPSSLVAFSETRTDSALHAVATRVLNNAVHAWLTSHRLDDETDALSRRGAAARFEFGPALRRRQVELGSSLALFAEIDSLLYGGVSDPGRRDRATATLVAAISDSLSLDEAIALLDISSLGPLTVHAVIGIARRLARSPNESTHLAQKLKDRGRLVEALLVLEDFDERFAPIWLLVEKALISKSLGKFREAAALFEACYATESSEFLQRELAMVLPEIEPISSILRRYSGDAGFLETVHHYAAFKAASAALSSIQGREGEALVHEILPSAVEPPPATTAASTTIDVLGLGAGVRDTHLGRLRILRPIDFARVRVSSRNGYATMRLRLDGRTIAECRGSLLTQGFEHSPLVHQIFNAWFEVGDAQPGAHSLQIYFQEGNGGYAVHDATVWIDRHDRERMPVGAPSLEDRYAALPSEHLKAERAYFEGELSRILVMRADQLGDTVLSFPAVAALRRHFPKAQIDALVSGAQLDLARGTGLFDEVFTVAFPYNQATRRRVLSAEDQKRLHDVLSARNYDLAIDLSPGPLTRPLLKLAGARYTAGFRPEEFPWLDIGLDLRVRDHGTRLEGVSHARAPAALVEAIAVAALGQPMNLPRIPLEPDFREKLGLTDGQRYAVFHGGARTLSRKWPLANYLAVARRIIQEHSIPVVLLLDHPSELVEEPADMLGGLKVLRWQPTFNEFDGLLSNCAVFLGNDSGPKHLAALRGAPVVSIHMGAVPWREWGQDGVGTVIARHVPCFGCGIELIEECGKGLPCLSGISPDEVTAAITAILAKASPDAKDAS